MRCLEKFQLSIDINLSSNPLRDRKIIYIEMCAHSTEVLGKRRVLIVLVMMAMFGIQTQLHATFL